MLIASSERRAHETAKIITPALSLPLVLDDQFVEWRSDDGSLFTISLLYPLLSYFALYT